MTDALLLNERVRNAIQIGESDYREFKSALEGPPNKKRNRPVRDICRDIGEALVAFANADGGELLIGVEDDGEISGVSHNELEIEQMLNATRTHVFPGSILPISHAVKLELNGKIVLFFSVSKGVTQIYQLPDGKCVRRKGRSSEPESVGKIEFDRREIRSREYDRQFVDGATINDLDTPFLQSIADRNLKGLTVEKYLQQIGLAEYTVNGLYLRMAALLLFAREIERWHPRSQVRILKIAGSQLISGVHYNVKSDEIVRGNIFELLQRSWEQLRPFLAVKTKFGIDAKFDQQYIYPEQACREALINAIAHRDYNIQNGIEVFIFDDRMEFKSPGALLSTLTIDDLIKLEGAHESRNVLISRVLRENKFMRELGEGIKRMFALMEENALDKPSLYSNSMWFSVTLLHKSIFTEQQANWLELFEPIELTLNQKKIVVLGMEGRSISRKDIYKAMNTENRDTYDKEVSGLRNAKILKEIMTNQQAAQYAKSNKLHKSSVPRFKVITPQQLNQESDVTKKNDPDCCVFVKNLPSSISKDTIQEKFEKYGIVNHINYPLDYITGKPRGFAFVWFDSIYSARDAINDLTGFYIEGNKISVNKFRPREKELGASKAADDVYK